MIIQAFVEKDVGPPRFLELGSVGDLANCTAPMPMIERKPTKTT